MVLGHLSGDVMLKRFGKVCGWGPWLRMAIFYFGASINRVRATENLFMLECLPLLRSFLFGKRFATSLLATSRAPPRASERLTRLAWMHAAPEDRRWFWMIFARDPQSAHDRKPVADSKMGSSSNWAIVEISAENCVAPHLFALHACRTLQHFVGDFELRDKSIKQYSGRVNQ